MPLFKDGEQILTAHASKQSKVSFKVFEAHTSVLVPLLLLPVFPFKTTVKFALVAILILILLERRGWTLTIALQRMRSRLAGRVRYRKTRSLMNKRMKFRQ